MKEGTLVAVWRDNGEVLITTTDSEVENRGGEDVVFVRGISGFYALSHVRPISEKNINPYAALAFAAMFTGS